ncbi:putative galacturonosyltransferase 11 [Nymphaea thermarum]|nr:putative galacturonosyltransferase 11 [Nymphaea thermarum]
MRRKDPRRHGRARFSNGVLGLFVFFVIIVCILFVVHHRQEDGSASRQMHAMNEDASYRSLNLMEEMLSATSFSRQLADQITLAKSYIVIAKESNNQPLAWELSLQIREAQLLLSKAVTREAPITPDEAEPIIKGFASLIYKAKEAHYDSATTIMSLKGHIESLEERANAAIAQSTLFGQLAAEELPKSLYCLGIKLTLEWTRNPSIEKHAKEQKNSPQFMDNNLYHFCMFSDNILATSVVVNSTVCNADHPKQLVFHIVTDGINYKAMQAWFFSNDYKGATVDVQNFEQFSWLNTSYVPVLKQLHDDEVQAFYFKGTEELRSELKFRNPKYLLNHLRFYMPDIFPSLEKVVFLDDDVVVQKDLTSLFSIDLHGNVNGAVETCLESFHRYYKYLNFSNPEISAKFDPQACGWAFGMNIFDLMEWKKANVTGRYRYWQEKNSDQMLWKLGTLPAGLLAFYGLTEPLDRRWQTLGLGYDSNIDNRLIESASVIHYNGNMKPWLKLAISRYIPLWERYVNFASPKLRECIVH